jgi:hypothetical protein
MFDVGMYMFGCLSLIPTEKEEEGNHTTTTCNHQSHPNGMVLMIYINGDG